MREARISIVNTHKRALEEAIAVCLQRAVERIHKVGRDKPDLILLAELFGNHQKEHTRAPVTEYAQDLRGEVTEELAALARRYRSYIAFGLLRRAGKRFFNSLVLLDRRGKPVWIFDKVTPMMTEMECAGITSAGAASRRGCNVERPVRRIRPASRSRRGDDSRDQYFRSPIARSWSVVHCSENVARNSLRAGLSS